jgi:hypothetical protein
MLTPPEKRVTTFGPDPPLICPSPDDVFYPGVPPEPQD